MFRYRRMRHDHYENHYSFSVSFAPGAKFEAFVFVKMSRYTQLEQNNDSHPAPGAEYGAWKEVKTFRYTRMRHAHCENHWCFSFFRAGRKLWSFCYRQNVMVHKLKQTKSSNFLAFLRPAQNYKAWKVVKTFRNTHSRHNYHKNYSFFSFFCAGRINWRSGA